MQHWGCVHTTWIAFAPAPYRIGLLFTRKNGDFGAIPVTERSRPLKWRVTCRMCSCYSWFTTTWQGGHVGGQKNKNFSRRIYMKKEFSFQRREMLLFLTTNMAAVTSRANQQYRIAFRVGTNSLIVYNKVTYLKYLLRCCRLLVWGLLLSR